MPNNDYDPLQGLRSRSKQEPVGPSASALRASIRPTSWGLGRLLRARWAHVVTRSSEKMTFHVC
eukprot:728536-Alexandrium_andersonii.AAC.1